MSFDSFLYQQSSSAARPKFPQIWEKQAGQDLHQIVQCLLVVALIGTIVRYADRVFAALGPLLYRRLNCTNCTTGKYKYLLLVAEEEETVT